MSQELNFAPEHVYIPRSSLLSEQVLCKVTLKKIHRTRQSPRNYKKITEHLTDFTVTLSQVEDEKQFSCFPGELTVRTVQFHSSFHQNSSDSQKYPSEQLGFPGVSIRTALIHTKILNIIRSNKNSSSFPGLTCLTNTFLSEHLPVAASTCIITGV